MENTATWIVPFTFIPGIGLLILSTANRFHHVNNLIRALPREQSDSKYQKKLLRRSRYFHNALTALYFAICCFSVSGLIGNLQQNWLADLGFFVDAENLLTTSGVVGVVFSAWQLMRESALSFRMIRRHEYIFQDRD